MNFFCISSLLNVVTISVDRFLAVHLHLRYQELVTHKRVIAAVVLKWLFSAVICSDLFWAPLFIISQRHKNQIQDLQIQEAQQGVQNGDLSNFLKLSKSALGTFYVCIVFLPCYLPSYILLFLFLARPLSLITLHEAWHYITTLVFLNSSLNPVIYCWKMGPIRRTRMNIMR
ncbi:unnamed protein product, partial [Pocillopora meandrina]